MIFELDCVKYFFGKEEVAQYEKLGFKFNKEGETFTRVLSHKSLINIDSLEVLGRLQEQFKGCPLVIDMLVDPPSIEIYDDYRE